MSSIIEVKGLKKNFGSLQVLKGIDAAIEENEVVCIIGPSGSGKSTFLRCLNRLEEITDGEILIDGVHLSKENENEVRTEMGMVFQSFNLFPHMSVLDNVKAGLHNHYRYSTTAGIFRFPNYFKVEKQMDERAMELLKVFGLDEECDYKASNLPYGKQRKLEIARALATEPKLLLLDEPAAGMNPNETQELMDTIRFVQEHFHMTTLLIEHDMKLVGGICEKLTVLNFGQVLTEGETSEVLNDPTVITAYLGE